MSERVSAELVSKIRKILSRTEASGCTQAEAEEAFSKASRLLAEHNLSLEDVKAGGQSVDEWLDEPICEASRWTVEENLAYGIAREFFFIEGYFSVTASGEGKILMFFGKKENVAVAKNTYELLLNAFDRLWMHYRIIEKKRPSDRRLYVTGVAKGFQDKLLEQRRAMEFERDIICGNSGSTALALVNVAQQTKAQYELAHPTRGKSKAANFAPLLGDRSTLEDGYRAGRKLNLNRGIGKSPEARKAIGNS